MVTEFGMSDAIGAINYEGNKRNRFLDLPLPAERGWYAEETAQKIDAEIKRILTDAHDKAREVLTANRDKLELVTRRLLEIEVMEGDELRRLLELPPAENPSTKCRSRRPIRQYAANVDARLKPRRSDRTEKKTGAQALAERNLAKREDACSFSARA